MNPKMIGMTLPMICICGLGAGWFLIVWRCCRKAVITTRPTSTKYGSALRNPFGAEPAGLGEVHPEEVEVHHLAGRVRRADGVVHRGVRRDEVLDLAQRLVQRDEDRHLGQERQATPERVDLVLLVELHQLFVELLLVVLVLRLQLLHLGLRPLHGDHRLRLLGGEREEDQPHHDGEHDDREAGVRDDSVEEARIQPIPSRMPSQTDCTSQLPASGLMRTGVRIGDGVEPARVPGVAAPEPAHREPGAPEQPVLGRRPRARTASTTARTGSAAGSRP